MCEWVGMVVDCMQFLLSVFIWPCTFLRPPTLLPLSFSRPLIRSTLLVFFFALFFCFSRWCWLLAAGCRWCFQFGRSLQSTDDIYLHIFHHTFIRRSCCFFLSTFICSSFYSGLGYYRMVFDLALVRFASCVTCLLCASEMCAYIYFLCAYRRRIQHSQPSVYCRTQNYDRFVPTFHRIALFFHHTKGRKLQIKRKRRWKPMEDTQHKHSKRSRSEIAVITIRFSSMASSASDRARTCTWTR